MTELERRRGQEDQATAASAIGPSVRMAPVLAAGLAILACEPAPPAGPDLILTRGVVYPGAAPDESVQGLAVQDRVIVAVGADEEIRALVGDATQQMTLDDAVVLPGFYDAWVDPEAVGRWTTGTDVSRSATPREVLARLREGAATTTEDWIVGWGWDETAWPRPELPRFEVLDGAVSDRPVVLYRQAGRVAWVNTPGLRALLDARASTEGLLRGDDDAPTGIVTGPALRALESIMPRPSRDTRTEWIAEGLRQVVAAGFTRIATAPVDGEAASIYVQLWRGGDLGPRVGLRMASGEIASVPQVVPPDELSVIAVGLSLDGPFTPPLAWLDGPGATAPADSEGALAAACEDASQRDLPLHAHAHGAGAVRALVSCPSLALVVGADVPPADLDPLPRLAAVPARLGHDLYWLDARLGPDAARAHAYRTALDGGALVALATNGPGYGLEPMVAVMFANLRQDASGYPLDGFHARERISVAEALSLATGVAAGVGQSRIVVDGPADLVVWSGDPFAEEAAALANIRAMVTIVDGRVVFSRPLVDLPFDLQ